MRPALLVAVIRYIFAEFWIGTTHGLTAPVSGSYGPRQRFLGTDSPPGEPTPDPISVLTERPCIFSPPDQLHGRSDGRSHPSVRGQLLHPVHRAAPAGAPSGREGGRVRR